MRGKSSYYFHYTIDLDLFLIAKPGGKIKMLSPASFADTVSFTGAVNNSDLAWHEVGAVGEPAFQNSWSNYATGYNTVAFRKDAFGFVHVKGAATGGTAGVAVFTLPVGYRPALISYFATPGAFISVTGAGAIALSVSAAISLDVISFFAGG